MPSPAEQTVMKRATALAQASAVGVAYAVISQPVALPADPLALWVDAETQRTLLWHQDGSWLLGEGCAVEATCDGPDRVIRMAAEQARIRALTVGDGPLPDAVFLTAWSFEESAPGASHWGSHLAGARLWLPSRLHWRRADGSGLLITVQAVDANGPLPRSQVPNRSAAPWPALTGDHRDAVEDAIGLIRDGALKKVVLARAVDETLPSAFEPTAALARLRAASPDATVYAHDLDDGGLFLGATPELLFAANDTCLHTMALAGSVRRTGNDQADSDALMLSTKQRKEHGLVVEHLAAVLRPRCAPLTIPNTPHARFTGRIAHLETLLTAELKRPEHLDLIGALHPTPAVCGLPAATAAHYLARRERLHRGLYAGVLGHLSPSDSRCVVPLRGGIVRNDTARLFAGGGIVETSDADDELAETELKLGVMRQALGLG
jgi:isochorismate synthase